MEIVTLDNVPRHINVSVKNRPAMRIAYVRHFGAYNRERGGIYEAACLLREWAETRKLDSKLPLIGQCHDNRRITPAHFCEYDIGIPIGPDVVEDDVVSVLTLPAGRYAIGHVSCKNEQLISAWDWLCSTWREHHSEPYQQRWNYEVFHHSQDGRLRPEEGVDICLRLTN
jgi:AraC family transcriptional regulator